MGRPVDTELRNVWRERLARQAASGMSVAEFCREEDVSEASYYGWRKRLAQEGRPRRRRGGGPSGSADQRVRQAEPEVRFVQLPLTSLPQPAAVEVTLADGTVIRVPSEEGELLERVLRMVLGHVPRGWREVSHD